MLCLIKNSLSKRLLHTSCLSICRLMSFQGSLSPSQCLRIIIENWHWLCHCEGCNRSSSGCWLRHLLQVLWSVHCHPFGSDAVNSIFAAFTSIAAAAAAAATLISIYPLLIFHPCLAMCNPAYQPTPHQTPAPGQAPAPTSPSSNIHPGSALILAERLGMLLVQHTAYLLFILTHPENDKILQIMQWQQSCVSRPTWGVEQSSLIVCAPLCDMQMLVISLNQLRGCIQEPVISSKLEAQEQVV